MTYKLSRVVDAQGFYQYSVLVKSQNGTFDDAVVYAYQLRQGESLVDAKSPAGAFCKPKWDAEQWIEGGTAEEVAAWAAAKAGIAASPTADERLDALEGAMLAVITGGVSDV